MTFHPQWGTYIPIDAYYRSSSCKDRLWGFLGEYPDELGIGETVAAAHRVVEMD